jgi:hypothetical protein
MLKKTYLIFILIFSATLIAQLEAQVIKGKVRSNDISLEHIIIKNFIDGYQAYTDIDGNYDIKYKEGRVILTIEKEGFEIFYLDTIINLKSIVKRDIYLVRHYLR